MIQSLANPQTLNRYTYCSNNPLKYTDPTGHGFSFSGLLKGSWDFIQGMGDSLLKTGDTIHKVLTTNPVTTLTEMGYALTHPLDIGAYYSKICTNPRGYGEYVGDILTCFATIEIGGAISKALTTSTEPVLPTALPTATDAGNATNSLLSKADDITDNLIKSEDGYIKLPSSSGEPYDPNHQSLIELAKYAKAAGGTSLDDANTLLNWADEYGIPYHGPEYGETGSWGPYNLHFHIGPVDHIPVVNYLDYFK